MKFAQFNIRILSESFYLKPILDIIISYIKVFLGKNKSFYSKNTSDKIISFKKEKEINISLNKLFLIGNFIINSKLVNLNNIVDLKGLFSGCSSLKSLPDISKWDTRNVIDISELFLDCRSLVI